MSKLCYLSINRIISLLQLEREIHFRTGNL